MKQSTYTDQNLFGVIGIGRFGYTLVTELVKAGKEVIAMDNDDTKLQPLKDTVSHLYQVDTLSRDTLREAGIPECATVIVCIGKDVESNLLATLNAIELGVPRVISKAISEEHGRILEKIGAQVVYPEEEMGLRLAKSLASRMTLDFLSLCDDFAIIEVEVAPGFDGKTILECDLRGRYGINVIAQIHGEKADGNITQGTRLHKGDRLVVAGTEKSLEAFQKANAKQA